MSSRSQRKRTRRKKAAQQRSTRVQDEDFVVDGSLVWHVLVMAPGNEHRVRRGLRDLGVEVFAPGYTEWVVVRGKRRPRRHLYFTRYVVFGVSGQGLGAVEGVDGVLEIVRYASTRVPVVIRPAELDTIARRLTGNEDERADIRKAMVMLGEVMRITEGPFTSFNAIVEEILRGDRLRVSVNIFGRHTPIELDLDQLEAA